MARFLTLDGAMGSMPEWYPLLRAARWMHVAPWDLMERPIFWMRIILDAEAAENEAERNRYARGE